MMAYSTEQMVKELKAAREAKGLSQRALSELVGVPQSHISKIERGGVDLRLSSFVEIARALDLEVMLVPRKNLSAVRSITRPRPQVTKEMEAAARGSKELQRLQNTIAKLSHEHPATKEIAQFQRRVNDLNRLKLPTSALEDLKKINDSLKLTTLETDTLRKITESLNQVQHLRNQFAHSQIDFPDIEKIRPAYSLEEDDHG
jgi:transcriptional regulator with XRE-family HTH domain